MKTKNLLMAVTALLVASCSQNEITEVRTDGKPAIGFDVYTGVATRGTDVTNTTMQETVDKLGGFGVMGYYTGSKTWEDAKGSVAPSFMHNQLVTYDTDNWTYTPAKYWPNNTSDKVSFFAYAPYEYTKDAEKRNLGIVTSGESDTSLPSITFTLKDKNNLDKMVDLVVAKELNKTATNNTINFNFEHTLTKVGFQAKLGKEYAGLDGTNSFVYITHMWVVGKTAANSLSILSTKLINDKSKFYTTAKWQDAHWNYTDADIAQEDYDLTNLLNVDKTGITEIWEDGSEPTVKGIKLSATNKTDAINLFPTNQFLYLIPVNDVAGEVTDNATTGGSGKDEIKIGFHYDIVTKTSDSPESAPKYLVSHFESAVPLPEHHMKRGKFYVYTFTINLNEITISSAEVPEWGTKIGEYPIN